MGAVPELVIIKCRSGALAADWLVYVPVIGNAYPNYPELQLCTNAASTNWSEVDAATSTYVHLKGGSVNAANQTFVAYLFATLPGISKIGKYTGNGSSQTINCGFSAGARFFLVKATSTTGSWWVFDSARGVIAAADPALQLNSTAAEITSADAVDPDVSGIIVNQEATCSINANGVSYVYLAIA